MKIIHYDGKAACAECCSACPVAELDSEKGSITLYDPEKPQNGTFTLSISEWNNLVAHAKPVNDKTDLRL